MLNSQSLFDKKLIASAGEYRELHQNRYTIRKLDHPFQRGWRRYYTLHEGARDRQDRPTLEAILEVIGSVVIHQDRRFQRRKRRGRKLFEIEQPLRPIPVHEWERKNYPDLWYRYFQYKILLGSNRHWQPFWVFCQPSLFQLKIGRNWIDQVRDIDPEVESRLGELDRWFEIHQGWRRLGWLKGQRQGWRYWNGENEKQRMLRKEHRCEISQAALDFPEIDPAASVWRILTSFRQAIFNFPGVAQCRGSELRPRPVQVRVLPPGFSMICFRTRSLGSEASGFYPDEQGANPCGFTL